MFHYTFFSQPSPLWQGVIALRMRVFVDEMQVPSELELDQYDAAAIHLCVQDGKQTIGTLRLIEDKKNTENTIKIGRFALNKVYRRQGIGTKMMHQTYHWCQQYAVSKLYLDAQTYIVPFYKTLGFIEQGDVFIDAGIPHVRMTYTLTEDL
ncbi:MAG TPA: GNAT family N-acetyltransferase [Thiothrix sp.]|nr:GNAT family N-acetyltransferase [Thiothrix sp.]